MFSFDFDQVLDILKWTFPQFKERISQLWKGPQSSACCVTRGVGVASAQRLGRPWKRTVWTIHWGFQLQGSFNPESLLLQKATDVSLLSLGSSYLDRHHRDTVHNKGLFEFSAWDCALTPDHWGWMRRADLIPASRCLCEILEFLSFTNTS